MVKSGRNAQRVAVAEVKSHLLKRILRVMEGQLPANPNDPRNDKGVNKIERVMVGYYDALFDMIDIDKLAIIYNNNVEEE